MCVVGCVYVCVSICDGEYVYYNECVRVHMCACKWVNEGVFKSVSVVREGVRVCVIEDVNVF